MKRGDYCEVFILNKWRKARFICVYEDRNYLTEVIVIENLPSPFGRNAAFLLEPHLVRVARQGAPE
jgi:hypothetical protein